jgi:hypothetical protein
MDSNDIGQAPAGYAAAVRRKPALGYARLTPSVAAPKHAVSFAAIASNSTLPRQPLLDTNGCKVQVECLSGATFHDPSSGFVFSELHRAGLPLSNRAPVTRGVRARNSNIKLC